MHTGFQNEKPPEVRVLVFHRNVEREYLRSIEQALVGETRTSAVTSVLEMSVRLAHIPACGVVQIAPDRSTHRLARICPFGGARSNSRRLRLVSSNAGKRPPVRRPSEQVRQFDASFGSDGRFRSAEWDRVFCSVLGCVCCVGKWRFGKRWWPLRVLRLSGLQLCVSLEQIQ